jgi:hypothetical protein
VPRPSKSSDMAYRIKRVRQLRAVIGRRLVLHVQAEHGGRPTDPACWHCGTLWGEMHGLDHALTILTQHDWGGVHHEP